MYFFCWVYTNYRIFQVNIKTVFLQLYDEEVLHAVFCFLFLLCFFSEH